MFITIEMIILCLIVCSIVWGKREITQDCSPSSLNIANKIHVSMLSHRTPICLLLHSEMAFQWKTPQYSIQIQQYELLRAKNWPMYSSTSHSFRSWCGRWNTFFCRCSTFVCFRTVPFSIIPPPIRKSLFLSLVHTSNTRVNTRFRLPCEVRKSILYKRIRMGTKIVRYFYRCVFYCCCSTRDPIFSIFQIIHFNEAFTSIAYSMWMRSNKIVTWSPGLYLYVSTNVYYWSSCPVHTIIFDLVRLINGEGDSLLGGEVLGWRWKAVKKRK